MAKDTDQLTELQRMTVDQARADGLEVLISSGQIIITGEHRFVMKAYGSALRSFGREALTLHASKYADTILIIDFTSEPGKDEPGDVNEGYRYNRTRKTRR